jgi:hypothetical protein
MDLFSSRAEPSRNQFTRRQFSAKRARVLYLQEITLLAAILVSPNHRADYLELSFQYL